MIRTICISLVNVTKDLTKQGRVGNLATLSGQFVRQSAHRRDKASARQERIVYINLNLILDALTVNQTKKCNEVIEIYVTCVAFEEGILFYFVEAVAEYNTRRARQCEGHDNYNDTIRGCTLRLRLG